MFVSMRPSLWLGQRGKEAPCRLRRLSSAKSRRSYPLLRKKSNVQVPSNFAHFDIRRDYKSRVFGAAVSWARALWTREVQGDIEFLIDASGVENSLVRSIGHQSFGFRECAKLFCGVLHDQGSNTTGEERNSDFKIAHCRYNCG